jgi:hypothetical protein
MKMKYYNILWFYGTDTYTTYVRPHCSSFREIHEELIEQWHFEIPIQKKKKYG